NAPGAVSQGVPEPAAAGASSARHTAIFDLVFELTEENGRLAGGIAYSTDLFDGTTIERMLRHFNLLLEGFVDHPDRAVSSLPILNAAEWRQLMQWSVNEQPYALQAGVVELFDAQAAMRPNDTAFLCGDAVLSHGELHRRSGQLARWLAQHGAAPETLVGIALDRSFDAVVAVLAVFKTGAGYLPLDVAYPPERLRFMLGDSGARLVVTRDEWRETFSRPGLEVVCVDGDAARIAGCQGTLPRHAFDAGRLAYALYTSGSTGRPKGVANTHRQLMNRLEWMWAAYPFAPGEVGCQKTALNFIDSLWELFGPLLRGVPTVILPDAALKDLSVLVDELGRHHVTRIWLVPSLLRVLLDTQPDLAERAPSLRFWVASGEVLPSELYAEFTRRLPEATLYNLYGTSEVWDATWWDPADGGDATWRVPIGKPIANLECLVLDAHMQPLPVGVPGELHVGGAGLPRGYLNRPDLSEQRLPPHPFSDKAGDRLYRTGDVVRWRPDGQLEFVGRRDQQLKIRGFRVEPGEVEAVLLTHPGVRNVAVVPCDDPAGGRMLVAYVVQSTDYQGTRSTVDEADGQALPWSDEKVAQWRTVWDEAYRLGSPADEAGFDTSGFVSSYTGQRIAAEDVRQWVDQAAAKVTRRRPRRVLELGCGGGLLALQIAAHCDRYVGCDFSPSALAKLAGLAPKFGLHQIELQERAADNLAGIDNQSFDAVVLHSVAQYMPSVDYLVRVLEGALRVTAPGGFIYLGDLRMHALLPAFHASVELHRAEDGTPLAALREGVRRRLAREQELAIDPLLFHRLQERLPALSGVRIEWKRGTLLNEFSRFRADVFLLVGQDADEGAQAGDCVCIDWDDHATRLADVADVADALARGNADRMLWRGVPNARVEDALALTARLDAPPDDTSDDAPASVRALRQWLASRTGAGVDPEAMAQAAEDAGFDIAFLWSGPGADGRFDALLTRHGS
ncbi:MAG: hypothetical protein JWP52_3135, partial [Rhizobacter sp.]|nr:hypothetical protein [Rhizobacter sp.]